MDINYASILAYACLKSIKINVNAHLINISLVKSIKNQHLSQRKSINLDFALLLNAQIAINKIS
jgi:hypothetical protein